MTAGTQHKNEIVHRIYDFIKNYPPFHLLNDTDLWSVSKTADVRYLDPGEILFDIGEMPPKLFYIVNDGAINLFQQDDTLVETCDEGDVLGLRPLIAQSPYLLRAVASEETLLYCISTEVFVPFIDKYPGVGKYIATNFAVGVGNKYHSSNQTKSSRDMSGIYTEARITKKDEPPIYIDGSISIRDAAKIMVNKKIGSIIICDERQYPKGIMTDKDLRTKVVAGDISKDEPVASIMSSPVVCVKPNLSIAELQLAMIRHKIDHLVVTDDGTPHNPVLAVISKRDLVVSQSNSPTNLFKEIQKAESIEKLKNLRDRLEELINGYIQNDVPVKFILEIASEINDEIIRKAIHLCELKADPHYFSEVEYTFLLMGSMARKEQLLRTDQDNAIIYHDNPALPDLKEKLLSLASDITKSLNEIGYEYCPSDMMASNPEHCLTLEEWEHTFYKWITQPGEKEVMMCTIFFDYRPVYGNQDLAVRLSEYIFKLLDKQEVFLRHLAQNAISNPPPLSFFRKFVVEKSGEHKDSFDIKLRAMMPMVDAARLLTLQYRIQGVYSTIERYQALVDKDSNNAELYHFAALAYETLLKVRTKHGIKNKDKGRHIQPDEMDKFSRLQLRNAFQPIHDLQNIIKIRFIL
jgi:CBS domain-containing protein